jgi:hypothetical protein
MFKSKGYSRNRQFKVQVTYLHDRMHRYNERLLFAQLRMRVDPQRCAHDSTKCCQHHEPRGMKTRAAPSIPSHLFDQNSALFVKDRKERFQRWVMKYTRDHLPRGAPVWHVRVNQYSWNLEDFFPRASWGDHMRHLFSSCGTIKNYNSNQPS